jgi:disulfide bond formation protein DsbB
MNIPLKNIIFLPIVFVGIFVTLMSIAALGFAFYMEHVRDLDPCHLCLLERWPYRLTALLGLLITILGIRKQKSAALIVLTLAALTFAGEAGLAFYHVGVEQHWWQSAFQGCTFNFNGGADLLAQVEAKPAARCDEIAWSLFGISMAGWNAVLALMLCLYSGFSVWAGLRRPQAG